MISKSASITIAVVALVIFAGITYFTIENTSASVSLSEKGYLNATLFELNGKPVNNSLESRFAPVGKDNQSIVIGLKIVTNGSSVYVFDISPVNNNTATWNNVTQITKFDNATYNIIYSNGSKKAVYYYPQSNVMNNYIRYNISNPTGTNETVYVNLTLSVMPSGFKAMNTSLPPTEIYPYTVKIIATSDNGGGGGTGFAVIKI